LGAIRLVPFHFHAHQAVLPRLVTRVGRVFARDVTVEPAGFDPEAFFDASRGQYNSTLALGKLLVEPGAEEKVLGLTAVDLFIPVLTYVFGEAQLDGRAGVVSVHRLDPRTYGLPPDEPLLLDRLIKEAVHELGHTFGLVHCPDPWCAMHASTYAEEIDLKGAELCPRCARAVK
jgi:archaemetzincin